jgi:hypothetical protein
MKRKQKRESSVWERERKREREREGEERSRFHGEVSGRRQRSGWGLRSVSPKRGKQKIRLSTGRERSVERYGISLSGLGTII